MAEEQTGSSSSADLVNGGKEKWGIPENVRPATIKRALGDRGIGFDPSRAFAVSVLNAEGCIHCSSFVIQKHQFFHRHFDIPPENNIVLFHGMREIAARALMDKEFSLLKDSVTVMVSSYLEELCKAYTEASYPVPYYFLVDEDGRLMQMGGFKLGADRGLLTQPSFRDSFYGLEGKEEQPRVMAGEKALDSLLRE